MLIIVATMFAGDPDCNASGQRMYFALTNCDIVATVCA